jgi:single-strand DNA-binding protein
MASYFNKAILIGNLTRDPELKQTTSGISVASFTLAINRDSRDESADYIDCTAWRQSAEFLSQYAAKGDSVLVEGRIQKRSWTDNNGQTRYAVEVVADRVKIVQSRKRDEQGADQPTAYTPSAYAPQGASFEELPAGDEALSF